MSPHLEVSDGEQAGRRLRVDDELLLGTAVAGEGRLADPTASRRHARLRAGDGGRVVLEDLNSTNGTWVNGERIATPRELDSGDVIRVGRTSFRFTESSAPAQPPATVFAGSPPAGSGLPQTVAGAARPDLSGTGTVVGGARPGGAGAETVVGGARPGGAGAETVVGGMRPGAQPPPGTDAGGERTDVSPAPDALVRTGSPPIPGSAETVVGTGAPPAAFAVETVVGSDRLSPPAPQASADAPDGLRRLAQLARGPNGGLLIEDLDASEPLRVNDETLRGIRRLAPGDRIEVGGDVRLVVEAEPAPAARPAADAGAAGAQAVAAPATQLKLIAGDATGRWIHPDDEVILGRGTGLPGGVGHDPEVSRRHAAVRRADGGLVIEDLGAANGTWVNGTRIQAPQALSVGDSVRLGETILLATDAHGQVPDRSATRSRPPSTPTSASPVEQNLEVVDGVGVGRRISLGMEVLIGRSVAEPGRVRDDLDVSRRHAVIRREPQGLTVEDLGSANGTYVNGRRIEGRCRLEPGDRLSVGRTTFAVSDLAGRIPPAPPAPD